METLSAGTTTSLYKLPTTSAAARDLHRATATSNLSSAPSTSRRRSLTSSAPPPSTLLLSTKPPPPPLPFHRRAATGYAAALLDNAQLGGPATLAAVGNDVARLSRLLRREEVREFVCGGTTTEEEMAELMRLVVEKGKFHGQLKVVLDLLIVKGRVLMFMEVLDEFDRIFRLLGHGLMGKKRVERFSYVS